MNNKTKIRVGVLGLIFIGFVWYCYQWSKEDFMPSEEDIQTINFTDINRSVYLRSKVWGIAGNHEEIVLSQLNKSVSNKAFDYIFYTTDVYYKSQNSGIITLYAPESSINEPVNKFSNITVTIKELKSTDEMNDYKVNFQKYGLKKISVYK